MRAKSRQAIDRFGVHFLENLLWFQQATMNVSVPRNCALAVVLQRVDSSG